MKKFYMMFAAIITLAAFSFVSCSDDDDKDSGIQKFTVYTEITSPTLAGSSTGAAILTELNKQVKEKYAAQFEDTESSAKEQFDFYIKTNKEAFQYNCNLTANKYGVTDMAWTVKMFNSNGKLVKQYVFNCQ